MNQVQEEIKPTGDGARSERQEPRSLRELDAEVAERVMGFHWFHCVAQTGVERNQFCPPEQADTWRRLGWQLTAISTPSPDEFNDDSTMPPYSTDIVAVMGVVDHFAEADWRIMLTSNPHAPVSLRWRVELFKELWPHCNNISVMELAETLPEAICLAALSAKAAEVNTR